MNISLPFNTSTNFSTTSMGSRKTALVVVQSFICLILNIAALVGNLLVCVALYRNPLLRTVTNNFVLSLALTDLLMAVIVMPAFTVSSFANSWIAGEVASQVTFFSFNVAAGVSQLGVMLLAVNRYFRVVRPTLYRRIYSKRSSALMVVTTWIVTILVSASITLLGISDEHNEFYPLSFSLCFPNKTASIYYHTALSVYKVFPFFVICSCYIRIYQTTRQHNTAASPSSLEGNSPYGVNEARITRLLTVVVVGFYLCWIPPYVVRVLEMLNMLPTTAARYLSFLHLFPIFTSSVINPIAYGVMNQLFRSEFVKIVRCR